MGTRQASPGARARQVRILAGPARGSAGQLLALETDRYKARVRVAGAGTLAGREMLFDYEHVSKAAD